jgi:tetratricopeptide (TPR) repeat protein
MLFDLRSGGRRTVVKATYLGLALLMFVGFVFFGIGGNISGFDLFGQSGGGSGDTAAQERLENQVRTADARTKRNPSDAAAWATLAQARIRLASFGDNLDSSTGNYTAEGRRQLTAAGAAWDKYIALDPPEPQERLARQMAQTYISLNNPAKAVSAQEVVTEVDPTEQTFSNLAILSYQAGQIRKGDLAADKAVDLAPKDEQKDLKDKLEQAKSQAALQQIQETAPTPTPTVG